MNNHERNVGSAKDKKQKQIHTHHQQQQTHNEIGVPHAPTWKRTVACHRPKIDRLLSPSKCLEFQRQCWGNFWEMGWCTELWAFLSAWIPSWNELSWTLARDIFLNLTLNTQMQKGYSGCCERWPPKDSRGKVSTTPLNEGLHQQGAKGTPS